MSRGARCQRGRRRRAHPARACRLPPPALPRPRAAPRARAAPAERLPPCRVRAEPEFGRSQTDARPPRPRAYSYALARRAAPQHDRDRAGPPAWVHARRRAAPGSWGQHGQGRGERPLNNNNPKPH
eukprot:scaffold3334_cov369-Prasinococcus_capsulatus_cf.AAC.1